MSENLQLQLEEVEALLATDPENQELQELKNELLEVIELASILKDNPEGAVSTENVNTDITENTESTENVDAHKNEPPIIEDKIKTEMNKIEPKTNYKVGDWCMAQLSDSGQYSPAKIDEITPDGQVTVTFQLYKYQQVTKVSEICEYMKRKFVRGDEERVRENKKLQKLQYEDIILESSKSETGSAMNAVAGESAETFKVGWWVMAKSSDSGIYSLAQIDDINSNGQVTVTFKLDKKQEVTTLSEIRKLKKRKRTRKRKKPQQEIETVP